MLIALRKAQFIDLTPSPPVTVMVPLTGRGHRARLAYLREHFHNPGVLPPDTGDNR